MLAIRSQVILAVFAAIFVALPLTLGKTSSCVMQTGSKHKSSGDRKITAVMFDAYKPQKSIVRRDKETKYLAGGTGACGITYEDKDHGAALWNGDDGKKFYNSDPKYISGWLTGKPEDSGNCRKALSVTAGKITIDVEVVDGASMGTDDLGIGCDRIYLTKSAFIALGGDTNAGSMEINSWKFKGTPV
ncbi:expressed protein [Phakopsora pachyrhizi]|uniref:Expressed protein n=1 Tax=Phakopsora pachyrhizi TaxID=170000 RepID=A0AAV0B6S4_PHAPC|nr:expressed protein [Phakopsora pachyrhizi]